MDAKNSSSMEKSKPSCHTPHQTQQLEAFFEVCPNPNEDQRKQLSRQLGLDEKQVKFWFHNKRNQKKVHNDRMDNTILQSDNERLQCESQSFPELLKNTVCSACDDHPPVVEKGRKLNVEKLTREVAQMTVEYERITNEITRRRKPTTYFLPMPHESFAHLMSTLTHNFFGEQSENSSIDFINSYNAIAAGKPIEINEEDKFFMLENAFNSINELDILLLSLEPLWVMSPTYGGFVLHDANYSKIFPKSRHLKRWSSQFESSKDFVVVPIAAPELAEMFLDMRKWVDLFPTIVMEAKIIETINTGSAGGSLHLMYKQTHIMSSFVAPREFIFLRYIKQMGPDTWVIMDTSYDCFKELQHMPPTYSWMFPSGVMIKSLPNGKSKVTWMNHVEFSESLTDPLYRDLLSSLHGYGAKRWLSTLERMIERSLYSLSPGSSTSPELEEGMNYFASRKNIMALSHRMIKDYCKILSLPERLNLSVFSEYKIKLSLRDNNEPGQPHGTIIAASTSVRLPLTLENLFNFLRDHNRKHEWDLNLNRSPVVEIAHMPTGSHPGNGISFFKTCISEKQNKMFLQENNIDSLGAFVVFAGLESQMIDDVMNGEDSSKISILPCGFSISHDRGSIGEGRRRPLGSLVTLVFQLPIKTNRGSILSIETIKEASKFLNEFVISIIQNLKVSLGCSELN